MARHRIRETKVQAVQGDEAGVPSTVVGTNFEGKIRLLGYDIDRREAGPGEWVEIELVWQALAPIDKSYTVFLHLMDPDGERVDERDRIPGANAYPTSAWEPGELIRDRYRFLVNDEYRGKSFGFEVGLYLPASGQPLSVVNDQGQELSATSAGLDGFRVR